MKISRDYLKGIVKECLLELLSEGLGSLSSPNKKVSEQRAVPVRSSVRPSSPLDAPRVVQSAALREAVKQESGGDPVLESILADTAKTTLPGFLANDRGQAMPTGPGASPEQHVVSQTTPEQLFGEEAAGRWASLAFMDAPSNVKKTA